jgi:hypothetical protein
MQDIRDSQHLTERGEGETIINCTDVIQILLRPFLWCSQYICRNCTNHEMLNV